MQKSLAKTDQSPKATPMSGLGLTPAEVERLLTDPSEQSRAKTARTVTHNLEKQKLTADERRLAEEIIRFLAKDAAVLVRQALADGMKDSSFLSPELAENLALDAELIALPILQNSPMLSDFFLMKIIRERGEPEQIAIASRADLSAPVVTTLVETAAEGAVATLMHNQRVQVAEHHLAFALERFPASDLVAAGVAARPAVPLHILEYLLAAATDTLRMQILARADYQPQMAMLVIEARERATLRIIGRGRTDKELEDVARQLIDSNRMTASLVLRTLCMGDLRFFEACMAATAKISLKNARALIHDQGSAGLGALYSRTGLFPNFLPAIQHALEITHEIDLDGGADDLVRYRQRLIERVLSDPRGMMADDIDYLLDKLGDLDGVAVA